MSEPAQDGPPLEPHLDPGTPRTYAQSPVLRVAWAAAFVLLLASTLAAGLLAAAGRWADAEDVPFLPLLVLLLAFATLWLLLVAVSVNRRIRVDDRGIQRLGLTAGPRIGWPDVAELTVGGHAAFAEGALGAKLFVQARDGTLITFTSRLRHVGELIDLIEARTNRSFQPPEDEAILPIRDDSPP